MVSTSTHSNTNSPPRPNTHTTTTIENIENISAEDPEDNGEHPCWSHRHMLRWIGEGNLKIEEDSEEGSEEGSEEDSEVDSEEDSEEDNELSITPPLPLLPHNPTPLPPPSTPTHSLSHPLAPSHTLSLPLTITCCSSFTPHSLLKTNLWVIFQWVNLTDSNLAPPP